MDEQSLKTFFSRVDMYRQFDEARQQDLDRICSEYQELAMKVDTLTKDLDDEKRNRHHWRRRAEQAEYSLNRNQYAVILVDGDGYIFNRELYGTDGESGGARAATALYNDTRQFLQHNDLDPDGELDITATLYCNQQVPAMVLVNAGVLQHPNQIYRFFWSFTSSRSFFQVVDCGPGKERADSKLRDVYKFYLNNAQCKYVFLACCHDSGYMAEIDKYRQDPVASAKTILIRHGNTAVDYARSGLRLATFANTFEMEPLQHVQRRQEANPTGSRPIQRAASTDDAASSSGTDIPEESGPANTWSTITANASSTTQLARSRPGTTSFTPSASADAFEPTQTSRNATGDPKTGIPVNRLNQRIDKRLQQPSQAELDRFEERIANRKLCNVEHLTTAGCYAYNCKYDHDPIDEKMKHTLKYKARSIPCATGSECRKKDCFYGHQCPWGADRCTNSKCNFWRNGLHEISDLEIAKYLPALE